MAGEGQINRQEQREYLLGALFDLPEQLVKDYGGQESAREAALVDARESFDDAAAEWDALRAAEERVETISASPLRQFLLGVAWGSEAYLLMWTPILVGCCLLLFAFGVMPVRAGRTLALELSVLGCALVIAPRLLAMMAFFLPTGPVRQAFEHKARQFRSLQWFNWSVLLLGVSLYLIRLLELRLDLVKVIGVALAFAGVSLFFARELIGRPLLAEFEIARERRRASRLDYEKKLRISALGRLRAGLSTRDSYAIDLRYKDYSGLAEMDDASREVPTATKNRLVEMMKLMPGGTVALAGPRGAGKSTLMRSVCKSASTRSKAQDPLHVIVDAPVQYEARDFVLHLFARFCTAVVGEEEVRELRGPDRLFGTSTTSSRLIGDPQLLLGIFGVGAGLLLTFTAAIGLPVTSSFGWGIVLVGGGYFLAVSRYVSARRLRASSDADLAGSSSDDANVHTAIQRLRQIWFQQSFSQGWSGGFKVPVGIEGGLSGSTELAEQQLSLPDIVDLFREFLGQVAAGREVRIGIDELDKMDDESARRFLNELKVVFRVSDCFFFLSISEEAMNHFERRGLHVRDVFDSSLDAVVQVPHLRFEVSRELLERRIVQLPYPFAALLHCLSGGLPRDLVRAARDLVALRQGTSLTDAATRLLRTGFRAKVDAVKAVSRIVELEERSFAFTNWIDRLDRVEFVPGNLLSVCREFDGALLELEDHGQAAELPARRAELRALAAQLVTFTYYAATLLEFFGKFTAREFAEEAIGDVPESSGTCLVDRLAAANQALSSSVSSGWQMLSDFRTEAGLEEGMPFPVRPVVAADEAVPAVP